MRDHYYDKLPNIKTGGIQQGFNKSFHHHRYEPTPFSALETLFEEYELKSSDRIVDFGCGKGRLNFFINYVYDATVVGIDMNELLYEEAMDNRKNYLKKVDTDKEKIEFHCCNAQKYQIKPEDNRFYFFNPFSVQVFNAIVNNILLSLETTPREVDLVLYYPSDDYIYFLENQTVFELKKEIILPGLYENNVNERFLIYSLSFV